MTTQPQVDKINAALQPLYSDPDFATVQGDLIVTFNQVPAVPAAILETVDVPRV